MGMLFRREADVSVMARTDVRNLPTFAYSRHFTYTLMSFWTAVRGAHGGKFNPLLGSYEIKVWYLILASFLSATLVFYAIYKANYRLDGVMLISFTILLEEGVTIPRTHSVKIRYMVLLLLLFSIIIATGYRTHIFASLTKPSKGDPIPESFQELDSSDYELNFAHVNSAGLHFFRHSPSPLVKRLNACLVETSISNCIASAFLDPKTACATLLNLANPITSHLRLSLSTIQQSFYRPQHPIYWSVVSFASLRGFEYVKHLDFIAGAYYDTGLIQKWIQDTNYRSKAEKEDWISKNRPTETYKMLSYIAHLQGGSSQSTIAALSLRHISSLLLLYTTLIGIAIFLFVGSWIIKYSNVLN